MTSTIYVEEVKGRTSGANANKVIIPADQTLLINSIHNHSGKAIVNSTGSILQVVQETLNLTSGTTSGTSSFATYISKAITPSSTTSKILILTTLNAYAQYTGWDGPQTRSQILRGTDIIAGNNLFYSRGNHNVAKYHSSDQNIPYLDSPNTTSEVTYHLQSKYWSGSSITFYNGYMTLMEVSA